MGWNLRSQNAGLCTWNGVKPGTSVNWEDSTWRAALPKGIWGCCLAAGARLTPGSQESAMCTSSQERKPHPRVQPTQCELPIKRGIIINFVCVCVCYRMFFSWYGIFCLLLIFTMSPLFSVWRQVHNLLIVQCSLMLASKRPWRMLSGTA